MCSKDEPVLRELAFKLHLSEVTRVWEMVITRVTCLKDIGWVA